MIRFEMVVSIASAFLPFDSPPKGSRLGHVKRLAPDALKVDESSFQT